MKTCPVCHGEGKIDATSTIAVVPARKPFLEQLGEILPNEWGFWSGVIVLILCITGLVYAGITAPPEPAAKAPELQCAEACGAGKFKAFTYPVGRWDEPDGSKYGKIHAPTPQKCECVLPGETP